MTAIRPLAYYVQQYGRIVLSPRRRNGLHWTWLLFDESLLSKLGTLEEERAEALRLVDERKRLQFGTEHRHQAHLKALERIVPGWYHRNDAHPQDAKVVEEKLREAEYLIQEREATAFHRKNYNHGEVQQQHGGGEGATTSAERERHSEPSKTRKDAEMAKYTAKRIRTLENMHLFRNQSTCPAKLDPSDIQITLVVQSTPERLWIIQRTCQRWKDPISLVLFWDSEESSQATEAALSQSRNMCKKLTIISHKANETMSSSPEENASERYPVNRLRNLGLDSVKTSHVMMTDIDFVPSEGLADRIRQAIKTRNQIRDKPDTHNSLPPEERDALVVPAFERIPPSELCVDAANCDLDTQESLSNLTLPKSFDDLRSCVKDHKECRVFQSHNNWDGHSSTRSNAWLDRKWYSDDELANDGKNNDNSNEIDWIRIRTLQCFDSVRYEPYVVLRWCRADSSPEAVDANRGPVAPYYDERFHGYGKNKIQLISHLRVMGYSFAILPEGFIVHAPHSISNAKRAWESEGKSDLHESMDKLYPQFLKELVEKYKHRGHKVIKQC